VIATRQRLKFFGPKKIRGWLIAHHPNIAWPAVSIIGNILKRAGLLAARKRARRPARQGALYPPPDRPIAEWAMDFEGWLRTAGGACCDPFTLAGDASRYLLAVKIAPLTMAASWALTLRPVLVFDDDLRAVVMQARYAAAQPYWARLQGAREGEFAASRLAHLPGVSPLDAAALGASDDCMNLVSGCVWPSSSGSRLAFAQDASRAAPLCAGDGVNIGATGDWPARILIAGDADEASRAACPNATLIDRTDRRRRGGGVAREIVDGGLSLERAPDWGVNARGDGRWRTRGLNR
jgi:hypothetical protein